MDLQALIEKNYLVLLTIDEFYGFVNQGFQYHFQFYLFLVFDHQNH